MKIRLVGENREERRRAKDSSLLPTLFNFASIAHGRLVNDKVRNREAMRRESNEKEKGMKL